MNQREHSRIRRKEIQEVPRKVKKTSLLLWSIMVIMILSACGEDHVADGGASEGTASTVADTQTEKPSAAQKASTTQKASAVEDASATEETSVTEAGENLQPSADVYSFLQGQKSWQKEDAWSGEWADYTEAGQVFGHFGCSFCCMANIYCTLAGQECSPLDMFTVTKEVTSYVPTAESAALGWGDMQSALAYTGISGELGNKPESLQSFAEMMQQHRTAIVLISSNNDATYWQKDGGHYVNIWDYNSTTGEVFLADPGGPARNRSVIPLQYVYDALKTSSSYQYLVIDGYSKANNQWNHEGIQEAWIHE